MKIIQLIANWYPWNDDHEAGEEYDRYDVGKNGVLSITEHRPNGPHDPVNDKWFYVVVFEGKGTKRIFNPTSVSFEQQPSSGE